MAALPTKAGPVKKKIIELDSSMLVLIIANPVEICLSIKDGLKKLGFNNTINCDDTLKAINIIKEQKVGFIICLYKMPHMDALELMEEVFNDPEISRKPYVIIDKDADEGDLALMKEREADAFMDIPVSQKLLADTVRKLWNKYNSKNSHEFLMEKARVAQLTTQYDIALKLYTAIAGHKSRIVQGRAYLGMARVYAKMDAVDEAVSNFHKALTQLPFKVHPHQELGKIFLSMGFSEQALHHFQTAIDISPKNPYRYEVLADIYIQHAKYQETLDLVQKAVDLGFDPEPLTAAKADALFHTQQNQEALTLYSQILQKTGSFDLSLLNKIAICFKRQKQYPQALSFYEKSLAKVKNNAELYFNYALSFVQTDQRDKAAEALKTAIKFKSPYYKAQRYLFILQKQNDKVKLMDQLTIKSAYLINLSYLSVLPYLEDRLNFIMTTVKQITDTLTEALPVILDTSKASNTDNAEVAKTLENQTKKEDEIGSEFMKEASHQDFLRQLVEAYKETLSITNQLLSNNRQFGPDVLQPAIDEIMKVQHLPYLQDAHETTLGKSACAKNLMDFSIGLYSYLSASNNYLFSELVNSSQKMSICIEDLISVKAKSSADVAKHLKKSEGGAGNSLTSENSAQLMANLDKNANKETEYLLNICGTLDKQQQLRLKVEPLLSMHRYMVNQLRALQDYEYLDAEKKFGQRCVGFWKEFVPTIRLKQERQDFFTALNSGD